MLFFFRCSLSFCVVSKKNFSDVSLSLSLYIITVKSSTYKPDSAVTKSGRSSGRYAFRESNNFVPFFPSMRRCTFSIFLSSLWTFDSIDWLNVFEKDERRDQFLMMLNTLSLSQPLNQKTGHLRWTRHRFHRHVRRRFGFTARTSERVLQRSYRRWVSDFLFFFSPNCCSLLFPLIFENLARRHRVWRIHINDATCADIYHHFLSSIAHNYIT